MTEPLTYLLGIDDTDSLFGHCTTHLGYLVVCELARIGCAFSTYPRLVRLNPNIPFKTRGNAAVCIEFEAFSERMRDEAFMAAERLLSEEADAANGANSALVIVSKDAHQEFFRQTYLRALNGLVNYKGILSAVSKMGIRHKLLGNGMGVVGAVASIGFLPESDDHTYELIAYRKPERCGTPRRVDPVSVKEMEAATFPHTFNSFDHESGRVLVAPTGPDPVLAGVRGDSPRVVLNAFRRVEIGEDLLGYVVYATNQCTDAHLTSELTLPLKAFSAGWLQGTIISTQVSEGSHRTIRLKVHDAEVNCMIYEPSGDLRHMARVLKPGDSVRLSGGVRKATTKNPTVLNVEKIQVLTATARIHSGTYLPSPRAQRHLTKQLIRYGREQTGPQALVEGWIEPQHHEPSSALSLLSASEANASIRAA